MTGIKRWWLGLAAVLGAVASDVFAALKHYGSNQQLQGSFVSERFLDMADQGVANLVNNIADLVGLNSLPMSRQQRDRFVQFGLWAFRIKPRNNNPVSWNHYVDTVVQRFETIFGIHIEDAVPQQLEQALSGMFDEDFSFLHQREQLIRHLQDMPPSADLLNSVFGQVFESISGRRISLELLETGDLLPAVLRGLSISVGPISSVLDQAPVIGFVAYHQHQTPSRPSRSGGLGLKIPVYGNYGGPGNPLPNGDPIDGLDAHFSEHDWNYEKHGWADPDSDRLLVQRIEHDFSKGAAWTHDADAVRTANLARKYF